MFHPHKPHFTRFSMLVFIIVALLIVLLLLLTFYFFHVHQRQKEQLITKKTLSVQVDKLKLRLKDDISIMVDSTCISQKQGDALYRVANYYFVYQSMTRENVTSYTELIGDLLGIINENVFPRLINEEEISESTKDIMSRFIHSLPPRTDGFTPGFYRNDLPVLFNNLREALAAEPEAEETTGDNNLVMES